MFRYIDAFISKLKYDHYMRKCRSGKYTNFTKDDLKVGTKIEWYHGVSTIIEIGRCAVLDPCKIEHGNIESKEQELYILDTYFYQSSEPDSIFDIDEILRIVK